MKQPKGKMDKGCSEQVRITEEKLQRVDKSMERSSSSAGLRKMQSKQILFVPIRLAKNESEKFTSTQPLRTNLLHIH